jgi:hypothetical protein
MLPPLTASDFGLDVLNIVNIQVLNGTIFILDNVQGIISFQYISNQAVNVQVTKFNFAPYWGMTIGNAGGNNVLLIAGSEYLWEFTWNLVSAPPQ